MHHAARYWPLLERQPTDTAKVVACPNKVTIFNFRVDSTVPDPIMLHASIMQDAHSYRTVRYVRKLYPPPAKRKQKRNMHR
jgi:hypothetical protein